MSGEAGRRLLEELAAGPGRCGYEAGVWDRPLIGEYIRAKYGVLYAGASPAGTLQKLDFSVPLRRQLTPAGPEFMPDATVERLQALLRRESDSKAAVRMRSFILRKGGQNRG